LSLLSRQRWPLAGAALFLSAAAFALFRVYHARLAWFYVDESVTVTLAWLTAQGLRLHQDLFWHHAPFAVNLGELFSRAGAGSDPGAFRLGLGLLQVLAGLAAALTPALRGHRFTACIAAWLYLVVWAILAPVNNGNMFLDYSLVGVFWPAAFALLAWPALAGEAPGTAAAALGGGALAAWLLCSPAEAPAGACFVLALALSGTLRRRDALAAAAGLLAVLGAQALWILVCSSPRTVYEQVVTYNREVYVRFSGESGAGPILTNWATSLYAHMRDAWPIDRALFACALAAPWALRKPGSSLRVPLLLTASFLLLRLRGGAWRAAGFQAAMTVLAAAFGAQLLLARRPVFRAVGAMACLALLLLAHQRGWKFYRYDGHDDDWHGGKRVERLKGLEAVRALQRPGDRLLALPTASDFYLLTGMQPSQKGVDYIAPMAAWEFPAGAPPLPDNLCTQVAARPPRFIFDDRQAEFWGRPWAQYAPPCITEFKLRYYRPLAGAEGWWVRK
jgi:hypothetical protein